MTREDLIEKYVAAHADCRWMDAGDLDDLLHSFVEELDSLMTADEDVLEAAKKIYETPFGTRAEDFEAGAEWQKEQMMKEAVNGEAHPDDCEIWCNLVGYGYKFKAGDKVKIIIIKED